MRRIGRLRAAVLVSACLVGVASGIAHADEPVSSGWWWAGRPTNAIPAVLTPVPAVPPGGLYVANGPHGPVGVSALRLEPPADAIEATLTLQISEASGTPVIDACPAGSPWQGTANGAWDERPTATCDAARVRGVLGDDGRTLTFAFSLDEGRPLDVVLTPGLGDDAGLGAPFSAALSPPGAQAFEAVAAGPTPPSPAERPAGDGPAITAPTFGAVPSPISDGVPPLAETPVPEEPTATTPPVVAPQSPIVAPSGETSNSFIASTILGVISGLLIGLLAMGLVLVFLAGRYINFAHAQMGVLSSMLLGKVVLDHGVPWLAGFVIAISAGCALGALIEWAVIRRVQRRSTLALLVTTLGVAQVLLALSFVRALQADPQRLLLEGYPVPFDTRIEVGALTLRGHHVLTLVVAPLLAALIIGLVTRTSIGRYIRAISSNRDAARLAGVRVRRISLITWAIAGGLSAVTAVLQAPSQTSLDVAAFGPGLLLRALGAAVLAGMTSLRLALVAGVGLGVIEAWALSWSGRSGTADAAVLGVLLVGLAIRTRRHRLPSAALADVLVEAEATAMPAHVRHHPLVRHAGLLLALFGIACGLIAPALPGLNTPGDHFFLTLTLIAAAVGISLTILIGWSGQVSLGQFAFVGVGAVLGSRLAEDGRPLGLALLLAGFAGAAIAVLVGLPALRLRGFSLAVTTLGLAVVAPTWLFRQRWFTGSADDTIPAPLVAGIGDLSNQRSLYFVTLGFLVLVAVTASQLRRSNVGRLMLAARDNENQVAAFGINPTAIRLRAFALTGFIAAASGVLWVAAWRSTSGTLLSPAESLVVLAVPIIGGLGSLAGAVLGAVALIGLPMLTSDALSSILPNTVQLTLVLAGGGLILTQLQFPGGMAAAYRRLWERIVLRLVPTTESAFAAPAGDLGPSGQGVGARTPRPRFPDGDRPVLAPDASQVLEIRNCSVDFGGIRALRSVDMQVHAGEIVGLIGANGAGKTTLLNVISGRIKPTDGDVVLGGQVVTGRSPHERARLGVGRSFQDAALFRGLTVRETIQVAAASRRRPRMVSDALHLPGAQARERAEAEQADRIMESFGLTDWSEALVGELSTGTRRVCDLAAQSAMRPQLLLLDEPTAGIAQREVESFGPLLRGLMAELGCAVVIVEHDVPLLVGLADRLYCLDAGAVLAEGSPAAVCDQPDVIAAYLGQTPEAINRSGSRSDVTSRRRTRPLISPIPMTSRSGNGQASTESPRSQPPSEGEAVVEV